MKETQAVREALDKARKEGALTEGQRVNLPSVSDSENAPGGLVQMSEKEFQRRILLYAKAHGWLVHHARPAKTGKGWRTPIQGDEGFPDLVLAKFGAVIFAELKSETGKTTANQEAWLDALAPRLGEAPIVCKWRPSDLPAIERILA